jgi:electron transfer flavoprotein alpha subunit
VIVEDPELEHFTVDAYAYVTYLALMERKPTVFLLGATPNGRDLAGRLAVRLRTGLNADCTDLRLSPVSNILVCEVSGFGGGVLALIEMERHRPQMATVRPGVFPAGEIDSSRQGKISHLDNELPESLVQTRIVERVVGQGLDLTKVPVLVAGGRGVDGDFGMLRELANLLGGDIGATRPPVDEGHIERERQIGQTGVVCRPKLAIACGISGAFHFVVGIQEADVVVAINSDPAAPIFDFADYCIVGDVHEIVPALIEHLKDTSDNIGAVVHQGSILSHPSQLEVPHG